MSKQIQVKYTHTTKLENKRLVLQGDVIKQINDIITTYPLKENKLSIFENTQFNVRIKLVVHIKLKKTHLRLHLPI